jgi:hypothetical protein
LSSPVAALVGMVGTLLTGLAVVVALVVIVLLLPEKVLGAVLVLSLP